MRRDGRAGEGKVEGEGEGGRDRGGEWLKEYGGITSLFSFFLTFFFFLSLLFPGVSMDSAT